MPKKLLRLFLVLSGLVSLPGWSTPAKPAPSEALWQPLAPGISYRRFFLPGPNLAYVARLDRQESQASLDSSLSQGRLNSGLETLRQQAARYDDTLSNWGVQPGVRNKVVAAINGSYFDPKTGLLTGGQVQSGWYIRRFHDHQNSSGFAWTSDRQAFIGSCVAQRPGKQVIHFEGSGDVRIDSINQAPPENGLAIYTPQFDSLTPAIPPDKHLAPGTLHSLEVVVSLTSPLWIIPAPDGVQGSVETLIENQGQTSLLFDHVVLSARGQAALAIRSKVRPGARLSISQELRHLTSNCKNDRPESWKKTYASISGGYILLSQGQIVPQDDLGAILRNPRSLIALNQRYIYFIVVDGRDRLHSWGMSMVEAAEFARTYLQASDAIAQDGGGSSTMVIHGQVVNHPNAALADQKQPVTDSSANQAAAVVERAVVNGMMMLSIEPAQFSKDLQAGARLGLHADGPVNLRLGPGTNYAVRLTAAPGSQALIQTHPLNGVFATGHYWWQVQVHDQTGWIAQEALAP